MAPIFEKPFLDYQIDKIRKYFSKTTIYLLTYYKSEIIENYYKSRENIKIIKESQPLGTGGSIKNAINILNLDIETQILILNGDTYIQPNLKEMINSKNEITILSSYQKNCSRYGILDIKDEKIDKFNEKVLNSKNSYINAGCYYFNNLSFFNSINKVSFSLEDEFKNYLFNYGKIYSYKYNGIFIDIGIPEDYKQMINYIKKGK
jgi:NDP-sugar pyrophosphorylase family protein